MQILPIGLLSRLSDHSGATHAVGSMLPNVKHPGRKKMGETTGLNRCWLDYNDESSWLSLVIMLKIYGLLISV